MYQPTPVPTLLPQGIETLKLDQEKALSNGPRPSALGMESCVGTEYVAWSSPLKLEGKVEQYMNSIISKMREELRIILRDSVKDYSTKPREKWLLDWCSQLILVVSQVYWCQEVEQVGGPAAAAAAGCVQCHRVSGFGAAAGSNMSMCAASCCT
jgi:dynein heavy chain